MMTFNHSLTKARSGRGFSLVELMIALLLGSLITIAALELFSSNRRTFQLQQGLTDVQEQGRFGLDYISRQLRMLGYEDDDLGIGSDAGLVLTDITEGSVTYSGSTNGTGNPGNDRLTFSRHGNIGDVDCEGDALSTAKLLVNTYWVQNSELRCMGNADAGTTGISILSGVDSFQVLIGIDDNQDNVPAATRYKTLNNVTAGTDQIATVRVGMVLQATQDLPTPATSKDILLLDRLLTSSGGGPVEEPAIRRVFVTTVRVRNMVWENI